MNYNKLFTLAIVLGMAITSYAQPDKLIDCMSTIGHYDLSKLWRTDSIRTEGDGEKVPFPEPLGYIGNNYQRFYIHFITVTKDRKNPFLYHVYGKTKVKDVICSFNGTITVTAAVISHESVHQAASSEGK